MAHVLSMTTPEAGNERIIVTAGAASSQKIADVLRAKFPELESRTPVGKPGTTSLPEGAFTISNAKAKRVLRCTFRSTEETMEEMVAEILEIEKSG